MAKTRKRSAQKTIKDLRDLLRKAREEYSRAAESESTVEERFSHAMESLEKAEARVEDLETRADNLVGAIAEAQNQFMANFRETHEMVKMLVTTNSQNAEVMRTLLLRLVHEPAKPTPVTQQQ